MFKLVRRWWKYLTAKLTGSFNERADPKVQLEQAIAEAQDQHQRLKEQAANVIANQKQTELRLNRTLEELEKLNGQARQAVLMADDATKKGDQATRPAAHPGGGDDRQPADHHRTGGRGPQDAWRCRPARPPTRPSRPCSRTPPMLQQKLAEKQKLMGQLDQAKMQEQMNSAMASLSETVGQDVPTFNEIRDKIEARYAKAKGMTELNETSVESRMLEIQQATENAEATARLAEIRAQLGLAPAAGRPRRRRRRRAPTADVTPTSRRPADASRPRRRA